jgi:signal transduction histidine kinase
LIIRPVPTALAAIVAEAVDAVTPLTAARAQPIQCQVPPDDLVVLADARYARQALANLLINASKYSVDGDTIVIRAEREGDGVRISVEDRGPGIPPAQQPDLFQRYYRVTPNNDAPGAGLGLAIVKGIVDAHGGSIGVDSQLGVGTRAWFTLPIVREPAR